MAQLKAVPGKSTSRGSITADALRLSLQQLQKNGQKVSISKVAAGANVTPALIHNRHPDIAEAIRKEMGKGAREQRKGLHTRLDEEKAASKRLRQENAALISEVRKLSSIAEGLRRENDLLKNAAMSNVSHMGSRK